MTSHTTHNGQSLVEVLIAVAVGVILITAAAGLIVPTLRINTQASRAQLGASLARELLENVRVFAESDWHNISNLTVGSFYYIHADTSPFTVSVGTEVLTLALPAPQTAVTYTRYFYVENVNRDTSDLIVSAGGSYDPSTKKITVAYSWPRSATSAISEYITRNRNNVFIQTDWSGGPGQSGPVMSPNSKFSASTANINYTSTTGSIFLNL